MSLKFLSWLPQFIQQRWPALKKWLPRTESWILFIGLACTVLGKAVVIKSYEPPNLFVELIYVTFYDLLFFTVIVLMISVLYLIKPTVFAARCALTVSILVSLWSLLNIAWLFKSKVQLQPGILGLFIRDFKQIWGLVLINIASKAGHVIILAIAIIIANAYLLWRFIKPREFTSNRRYRARCVVATVSVIILLLLTQPLFCRSGTSLGVFGESLNLNSHWYALISLINGPNKNHDHAENSRIIPRVGERQVVVPVSPAKNLPNVVLVLLETVPYSVTSLSNPELVTTPYLASLAKESTEFKRTYLSVSHTNKVFWATLTGSTPVITADSVEAVLIDKPYEGLPSLLARVGYRSGHFEMTKGTCECGPGLFYNLAFDWAWFRENLGDSSAYLGPFAGDDCRMIEPAFEWALKESNPFLLVLISSVAHGPGQYQLPNSFGERGKTLYDKYLDTVRYTDYYLQKICKTLKERGLEDNTILCVLGDHGGSFRALANNSRFVPYEEVIRVPWLIRWPGHIKAGEKIDWLCSQMDITPTVLKLIGFDITNAGFDGKDAFIPSDANRRLYFSSWFYNTPMGFVEGNKKVVYWPDLDKVFEYDLSIDPLETNSRAVPEYQRKQLKQDILDWQSGTQIYIDPKRYRDCLVYDHWQIFCTGRSPWAYYVP